VAATKLKDSAAAPPFQRSVFSTASGVIFVDEEFIRLLSRGFATITND